MKVRGEITWIPSKKAEKTNDLVLASCNRTKTALRGSSRRIRRKDDCWLFPPIYPPAIRNEITRLRWKLYRDENRFQTYDPSVFAEIFFHHTIHRQPILSANKLFRVIFQSFSVAYNIINLTY